MALHDDGGPAPYAPPSAILGVIDAYRERGLQTPFTPDVLARAGVTEALAPRTLQALRLLDLINREGNPTEDLQALRVTPSDEFPQRLAQLIQAAYAPIFTFVDPGEDPPERIRDAFRVYSPVGQQPRMLTLFLGLCETAGIYKASDRQGGAKTPRQARKTNAHRARKTTNRDDRGGGGTRFRGNLPEAIAAQVNELPDRWPGWDKEKRDTFLRAFGSLLDLYFPTAPTTSDQVETDAKKEGGDDD